MAVELEPEHIERAERFARAITLASSSFEYFVAVVREPELTEPFARRVAGSVATRGGARVCVSHLAWAGAAAGIEHIEALVDVGTDAQPTLRLVIMDLSQLLDSELEQALVVARALNLHRDTLGGRLVGGLLLCLPDWLEPRFAAAAPDLWSVVSSTLLRRGAETFPAAVMDGWWDECDARFAVLRGSLATDIYAHGTYTLAYAFEPGGVDLRNRELLELLRRVPQYTGWATWLVPDRDNVPYSESGAIECWLYRPDMDAAHADVWRAHGAGRFYLRRGYSEDVKPLASQSFSSYLPIWRTGETLLHARNLARLLSLRPHVRLRVRARWDGLRGRTLTAWPQKLDALPRSLSRTEDIVTELQLEVGDLANLVEPIEHLTRELFECFDFHVVPREAIAHHLERLEQRR